jgi:quercetin dioxygenase-like cupin family protein
MPTANSESLVNDERAIVTKWTLPSGAETGSHTHGFDYLVVYLNDGILTVEAEGQIVEASISKQSRHGRQASATTCQTNPAV